MLPRALTSTANLNSITESTNKGFPVNFAFEGSNDTQTWTPIASYSNYLRPVYEETQEFNFVNQQYRYVRLSVSECSEIGDELLPFALQLNEFKIFNFNSEEDIYPTYSAQTGVYSAATDLSSTQGANNWSYMRQPAIFIQNMDEYGLSVYNINNHC